MLTSANVIMVSVIVADFLYRKTMLTSVFSQVRIEISTQSYSNFGLDPQPIKAARPSGGCTSPTARMLRLYRSGTVTAGNGTSALSGRSQVIVAVQAMNHAIATYWQVAAAQT